MIAGAKYPSISGLVLSGVSSDTPPPGTNDDSPIPIIPSSVYVRIITLTCLLYVIAVI